VLLLELGQLSVTESKTDDRCISLQMALIYYINQTTFGKYQ